MQPSNLLPLLDCATPIFQNISIETTTICNLRCPYCPNSTIGPPPAYMPDATFYRIIDSVADFQPGYCGKISPHFYGEPLLDTRLEEFVRYAHKRLPQALIQIFTNGEMLTVDFFLALVNAGVQKFVISQHSPLPVPHLMDTLKIIHSNYADRARIEYFDQYHSNMKMNRGGLLTSNKCNNPQLFRCNQYKDLVFDVSGAVVLCCNDYLSSTTFGTIHGSSVRDIWQSVDYTRIRNQLYYSYFPLPICKKCSFL
jgi:MoaA/NifB/PqqE/SkfB family radical SAM enzyme